jgi:tetratricopeptide (TPR) repeat protein
MIFYSPYSAVWTQAGTRPDLPTVSAAEIEAAFDGDAAAHGLPVSMTMYGRSILELNSLGLEDFAFAKLTGLPKNFHRASWYWEGARIMCFDPPMFSAAHRSQLLAEAEALHDDALTADFRAHVLAAGGDAEGARKILAALPPGRLGSPAGDLLLRIELDQDRPEALALAERRGDFDLRDGWHWALLGRAEEQAGRDQAALAAWEKAVAYYPDEPGLVEQAAAFAARHHATGLQRAISAGVPMPLPAAAPEFPVH